MWRMRAAALHGIYPTRGTIAGARGELLTWGESSHSDIPAEGVNDSQKCINSHHLEHEQPNYIAIQFSYSKHADHGAFL